MNTPVPANASAPTSTDWTWFEVPCLDSTNLFLRERVRSGQVSRGIVWAKEQHAGRGRLGRVWLSPQGGLYLSLSVPVFHTHNPHLYSMAVAITVASHLTHEYQVTAGLKWPNDIVVVPQTTDGAESERKVGGILSEWLPDAPHGPHLVVGLGLNINTPISLADPQNSLPPMALSTCCGREIDLPALVQELVQQIGHTWSQDHDPSWPANIQQQAKQWTRTLGQSVRIHLHDRILEGLAIDLSPSLGLYLKDQLGQQHEIHSGDCIHLRPKDRQTSASGTNQQDSPSR